MIIVAEFDPSSATSSTFKVPQSSFNGSMVVWNESNISLMFTFQTGDQAYIPAWSARKFVGSYGGSVVSWAQQAQLASNQPPLSQVVVEVYAQGENAHEIFPQSLASRQNNIGNAATVTTAASSVQNDGNVAGTSVVEATVSGDVGSAVQITNAGIATFGTAAHHGSVTAVGGGFTGVGVTSTGGLTVSGGGTSLDGGAITSNGAGDLTMLSALFTSGSLTRIAKAGPFSLTSTKTNFNHLLGDVPDFVFWLILTSAPVVDHSVYVDLTNATSTQVGLKAGGPVTAYILSIKL